MTIFQRIQSKSHRLVERSLETTHSRIVAFSVIAICLTYLPRWFHTIFNGLVNGNSSPILNLGFLYVGLQEIWEGRKKLTQMEPAESDRWLGYLLIFAGVVISPFVQSSYSLQAVLIGIIIVGILFSTWGLQFFQQFFLSSVLLVISIYPSLLFVGNSVRKVLSSNSLEVGMAWVSSLTLIALGQPAIAQGTLLSLSPTLTTNKSVEVASGCSGFDMAFCLAGMAIIMGLVLKQKWSSILWMVVAGVALALILNVPRIVLLAWSVVYWGKESFEFWHGPIGGQIFAAILITLYYYLAMWIVDYQSKKMHH